MTQNIYDDHGFFRAYAELPRSRNGLQGAPEWPALRAMLPNIRERHVLDLGCGYGWFCRWARENGAGQVTGIDVSEKMLARARSLTKDPAIAYRREDLEAIRLQAKVYALVYSSLTFHYLKNLEALLGEVRSALLPQGKLVFSVEHPIYTAPVRPAWIDQAAGVKAWALNRYLVEGERSTDWLAKGVIKQHRTIASYVRLLLRQGFRLTHLQEWGPSEEQIAAQPALADERERPAFLLIAAEQELSPAR
jgi:SAM-dependent methyltransferase